MDMIASINSRLLAMEIKEDKVERRAADSPSLPAITHANKWRVSVSPLESISETVHNKVAKQLCKLGLQSSGSSEEDVDTDNDFAEDNISQGKDTGERQSQVEQGVPIPPLLKIFSGHT